MWRAAYDGRADINAAELMKPAGHTAWGGGGGGGDAGVGEGVGARV